MTKSVALVTGASRGIGAVVALTLAKEGYDVAVNYNKSSDKAEEIVRLIEKIGVGGIAVKADVSKEEEVTEMFSIIRRELGEVDIVVCNAGIAGQMQIQDISKERWKQFFETNVDGMFHVVQEAIPHMLSEHSGCIVAISSIWGLRGASCESAYSATKAAIIGFSKSLAKELGPTGIRVNCVAPGVIDTEMLDEFSDDIKKSLAEETPLERLGTPEDVANVVSYLVSDKAAFVTGQIITCDGGFIV